MLSEEIDSQRRQAVDLGSPADGVRVREVPCSADPGVCMIQRAGAKPTDQKVRNFNPHRGHLAQMF